jgi:thiol-disulfide isomerase/thioredoxin
MNQIDRAGASRRHWLYGSVAALAGLGGVGLAWWRFSPAEVDEAALTALWHTVFEAPDGTQLPMSGFRGRPLLVNFWATWCPPCVEEFPLLDSFYRKNKANGWQVLGLAIDRVGPVQNFLAHQSIQFPVAMAGMEGIALSKSMGNVGGGLPFTIMLGGDGAVVARKIGKLSAQDLDRWHGLK